MGICCGVHQHIATARKRPIDESENGIEEICDADVGFVGAATPANYVETEAIVRWVILEETSVRAHGRAVDYVTDTVAPQRPHIVTDVTDEQRREGEGVPIQRAE